MKLRDVMITLISAHNFSYIAENCKLPCQRDTVREEFLTSDVGPVLRRFLTRADDFFDDPFFLTLADELARRQVVE